MRVLHFYKNALPESIGGIEHVIDQIARGTGGLGVKNSILTLSDMPSKYPILINGYQLFTAKRNFALASNSFSWQSISLFRELTAKADLIHYHFPWPFADLVQQIVSPKKPSIVTYHSDIVRQKLLLPIYRPLKYRFLQAIDHIVATSPNYQLTSDVLIKYSDKTSVIPIGLDDDTFVKPDSNLTKEYKRLFGDRFFLFIGAFRYYKGLNFLVEAAKIVPYPIVIAGSGPTQNELKSFAQRHELKNVFLVGQIDEQSKSSLLEASYGVIFPSHLRSEAFGVTLLEGAMFKKPLISCEIGTGTTYINIHQKTGLVIKPSDPKALADAMTWLWTNPEKAIEMGVNARARFDSLFTAKKMAQSYFDLYKKLVNY
jgi:O-antigen biosynthesis rhamnosyltransferase